MLLFDGCSAGKIAGLNRESLVGGGKTQLTPYAISIYPPPRLSEN
jgi:hypothetical protein